MIHPEDKANHLWCAFQNRMGLSNKVVMQFDLGSLISATNEVNLDDLAAPFLVFEIEDVIKNMPSDKAPRPDRFNGVFIKKCRHIIKTDIF